MQAPADGIPPFWTEPWRWAAPAWRRRYGAPECDVDCRAARLIYSGWAACFDLPRQWCPPGDPRWRAIAQASPTVLAGVASVLGHIALLRAGRSVALMCRGAIGPWLALALKYRDVNSMRSIAVATRRTSACPCPERAGVDVLRIMARLDWPAIESRIAMLVSPLHDGAGDDGSELMPDASVAIEWVHLDLCLSLCCAVVRQATARLPGAQDAQ